MQGFCLLANFHLLFLNQMFFLKCNQGLYFYIFSKCVVTSLFCSKLCSGSLFHSKAKILIMPYLALQNVFLSSPDPPCLFGCIFYYSPLTLLQPHLLPCCSLNLPYFCLKAFALLHSTLNTSSSSLQPPNLHG